MNYTDDMLSALRDRVKARMSAKRFSHTVGVERMAERLGLLIIPEEVSELRAAALLHDIAKEIPLEEQILLLKKENFPLTDRDLRSPGVIHSFAGPIVVKRDFPDFSSDKILNAVLFHTVGDAQMSVFDKIIFVSDYTEDTRVYDSCIAVRELLLSGIDELNKSERLKRLDDVCIASIDGALMAIERAGRPVNLRMLETKKSILEKKLQS